MMNYNLLPMAMSEIEMSTVIFDLRWIALSPSLHPHSRKKNNNGDEVRKIIKKIVRTAKESNT